jgi:apolipoprotein N-acyltransferase
LFTGFACGLVGWASGRWRSAGWLPLFTAVVWSALEYYRCEWFWLRFPWITPGIALGPTWLSTFVGVYGASGLFILASACLVARTKPARLTGAAFTLILAALAFFRPGPVSEPGAGIPILAVQSENLDLTTYRERTLENGFRSGIALWPEYAAPFPIREGPDDLGKLRTLARDQDLTIVFGTQRSLPGDKHANEAMTIDGNGVIGSHDKNRPVPFMDDGEPGRTAAPVLTRFGRLGTPICFDCDYTEVVRRMTTAGAGAFTVPSLDAVHWSRRQHLQHAELFRHRALENGRWFAVCASSGMTQIVDPHGNRVAELPLMEDHLLRGTIHLRHELTFYSRFGWLFPWVMTAAALVWVGALLLRARRPLTPA